MAKFCKPMGLYVTYLDCLECEGKECRQSHKVRKEEKEMKKVYLQVEPEQEVFLVFASKREKYKNPNIQIQNSYYFCSPNHNVNCKTT